MFHRARQDIGDRLDPPVRVPGEPGHIVARAVAAEIVEQQEGVRLRRVLEPEGAVQMDARALDMGLRAAGLDHGTDGHGMSPDCVAREMGQQSPCAKA